MSYSINVVVNRPTWEALDAWAEEFKDVSGIDPDDDPRAQLKADIWNNVQHRFRIWRLYKTEEQAIKVVQKLQNTVSQADYTILPLISKKARGPAADDS